MYDYKKVLSNVDKIYNQFIINKLKDEGFSAYFDFYQNFVKAFENYEHYEKPFEIINPFFERHLDSFLQLDNNKFKTFNEDKINICFYLPNIANSLAHIDFLHKTLCDFNLQKYDLYIATNTTDSNYISSKIKDLVGKKIIKEIINVDITSVNQIINFSYCYKNFFEKFIVWALPLIIPLWIRIFGDKVIYVSLKFKYHSFEKLSKGIYFSIDKKYGDCKLKNTIWKKTETELVDLHFDEHSKKINKKNIKLITVNRIEKIKNEYFLDTVCQVLKKVKSSSFSYTGRHDDQFIRNYFRKNNLESRINFIGWVNPNEIVNDYDIFLDVPYLSGIISANYFISGMPVASFDNTTSSYINMIKGELYSQFKINFTFSSKKEYVDYVVKLSSNTMFLNKIRNVQISSKPLFTKKNINLSELFFKALNEKDTI